MARKPAPTFHIKDLAKTLGVNPSVARRRNRIAQERGVSWSRRHVPGHRHEYYEKDRATVQTELFNK